MFVIVKQNIFKNPFAIRDIRTWHKMTIANKSILNKIPL